MRNGGKKGVVLKSELFYGVWADVKVKLWQWSLTMDEPLFAALQTSLKEVGRIRSGMQSPAREFRFDVSGNRVLFSETLEVQVGAVPEPQGGGRGRDWVGSSSSRRTSRR